MLINIRLIHSNTFNSGSNSEHIELQEFAIMVSIEKALNPFYLVICFLGCGIFRHTLDHSRLCFSIFYILTVWSVYACVFYYMVTLFESYRIFEGFLFSSMIITNLLVIIISTIITVCEHKKFHTCIKNLSLIDDTLEQLGTFKEYCKMQKSIKCILIILFIISCITWAVDAYACIEKFQDIRAMIVPVVVYYPFHLNTLMDIIFTFLLRYIGNRFDKINGYIGQLSEIKEYGLRWTCRKSLITRHHVRSTENRENVLWTAMHLHLELCRIARNINNFFEIRMTLQMISYFIFLTGVFYFQYHIVLCFKQIYGDNTSRKLRFLIYFNMWCGLCIAKLVTLNYICESVGAKAEQTKEMIHRLTNFVYFDQIREDICQFILQISLQPLKFNGMGLFYFGYKFILKFSIGVVSILIFMVQMENSPLSRILFFNESCYDSGLNEKNK